MKPMQRLIPPSATLYDYQSLAHFIAVWWHKEKTTQWAGAGYAACSPIHSKSVTSRQWDAAGGLLDDELEKTTANLLGECMDKLEAVDRCLIVYAECGVPSLWVNDMEPARAQLRYENALINLANLCRREGVDV